MQAYSLPKRGKKKNEIKKKKPPEKCYNFTLHLSVLVFYKINMAHALPPHPTPCGKNPNQINKNKKQNIMLIF